MAADDRHSRRPARQTPSETCTTPVISLSMSRRAPTSAISAPTTTSIITATASTAATSSPSSSSAAEHHLHTNHMHYRSHDEAEPPDAQVDVAENALISEWVTVLKDWEPIRAVEAAVYLESSTTAAAGQPPTTTTTTRLPFGHSYRRHKMQATFARLCPRGIPRELRALVWQKILNVEKYRRAGMYVELLSRPPLAIYDQIERDIARTFPHHVLFKDPSSPGQVQLLNVLKAYAQYNPEVGYTQGMNFITALLLLHMPPDESFFTLVALISTHAFPHNDPTLAQLHAACGVFDELVERHLPRLHRFFHVDGTTAGAMSFARRAAPAGVASVMFLPRWWMSGWEVCPWGCRVRAWDCVVGEGHIAFYKFSLAILACIEDVILHPLARDLTPDAVTAQYGRFSGSVTLAEVERIKKRLGGAAVAPSAPPVAQQQQQQQQGQLVPVGSPRRLATAGAGAAKHVFGRVMGAVWHSPRLGAGGGGTPTSEEPPAS
ncbi:hypothetical protein RI367_003500 [Sorochytrium milnesiophthora]